MDPIMVGIFGTMLGGGGVAVVTCAALEWVLK